MKCSNTVELSTQKVLSKKKKIPWDQQTQKIKTFLRCSFNNAAS